MPQPALPKPLASIGIPQLAGGGAEKIVMRLARFLNEEGQLSRVYTASGAGAEQFVGITIVPLRGPRALQALPILAACLKGDQAEIFLLTLGYVNLAPLLKLLRPSARIVIRIGSIVSVEASYRSRASRVRYMAGLRLACRSADRIIVQGCFMGEDLTRHLPWTRPKVRTIHNFIEDELWAHPVSAERPLAEPYIFCAATMKPEKAFDILLPAFARSSARDGRKLVVAGIAPDDERFNSLMLMSGLGAEQVIRLGFVPMPYNWIAHAELCVLASRFEGFSNFLIEAAAFGKHVVATDCPGGNAELFQLYGNVTAVPVGDIEQLSFALAAPRRDLHRQEARRLLHRFERAKVTADYLAALFD